MNSNAAAAALAALEALDTERLIDSYADEFLFEDASWQQAITVKDDLRVYFDRLFSLPEVGFTITRSSHTDGFGFAEWIWSGRGGAGEKYAVPGASIFEFGADGITREAIYYDPAPVGA